MVSGPGVDCERVEASLRPGTLEALRSVLGPGESLNGLVQAAVDEAVRRREEAAGQGGPAITEAERERRREAMRRLQAKVAALGPAEPWTAEVAYHNGLEEITLRALGRGASPAELGAMLTAMGEVLRAGPEVPENGDEHYTLVQHALAAAKGAPPELSALPEPDAG